MGSRLYGRESLIVGGLVVGRPGWSTPPFSARVQWAVSGDGRIAVVFPDPYRVDLINSDGRREIGAPIQYERVRLTEALKEYWREEQSTGFSVVRGRDGSRSKAPMVPPFIEPSRWPVFLPPFLDDAVSFDPDGTLWVRRAMDLDDPPTYELFDKASIRIQVVTLPKDTRLIGFGTNSVYLARSDSNGNEFLERYPRRRR